MYYTRLYDAGTKTKTAGWTSEGSSNWRLRTTGVLARTAGSWRGSSNRILVYLLASNRILVYLLSSNRILAYLLSSNRILVYLLSSNRIRVSNLSSSHIFAYDESGLVGEWMTLVRGV